MISSTATAIYNIGHSLEQLAAFSDKISDPDTPADASDIVALKEATAAAEISVAVLNKINRTNRLVDIIA